MRGTRGSNGGAVPEKGDAPLDQAERIARATPLVVILYFAIQATIRVLISPSLEVDEANFVDAIHFALGYGNSHPPLYNWLVALVHGVTGGHWPLTMAILKNSLLAGMYCLAYDAVRRATGRALSGVLIVLSFLLLPQIVWQAQITLAHSVLLMFGLVASCHALVLISQRGTLLNFAWLGCAMSIGLMAKYNMVLFVVGVALAIASIPTLRRQFSLYSVMVIAAIILVAVTPHALWMAINADIATSRVEKLYVTHPVWGAFDMPNLGIDGLLSTGEMVLAWIGPLLVVWSIFHWHETRHNPTELREQQAKAMDQADMARLFFRIALISLILFAVFVLLSDVHKVRERYVTPAMIAVPFWLVLAFPVGVVERSLKNMAWIAAGIAVAVTVAWPSTILIGDQRLALPYDALSQDFADLVENDAVVLTDREVDGANFAMRLTGDRFATASPERQRRLDPPALPNAILIIWPGDTPSAPGHLTALIPGCAASHEAVTSTHAYLYFSGETATYTAQACRRPPSAEQKE